MIAVAPTTPQDRLILWRVLFPIIRAVGLFLCPIRLEGAERLPKDGAMLIVSNHANWKDPPWIAFALNRAVRFMAKSELFEVPIIGGALRAAGNFAVRRGESDRRAVVTALRVLEAGLPLGFFPEGHRSEDGALIRAHPGIGMLAQRSGAKIVPLAVIGSKRARLGAFWRRDVTIRVGEPFYARDLGTKDDREVADGIMRRIAGLLPPDMHGVYAAAGRSS